MWFTVGIIWESLWWLLWSLINVDFTMLWWLYLYTVEFTVVVTAAVWLLWELYGSHCGGYCSR